MLPVNMSRCVHDPSLVHFDCIFLKLNSIKVCSTVGLSRSLIAHVISKINTILCNIIDIIMCCHFFVLNCTIEWTSIKVEFDGSWNSWWAVRIINIWTSQRGFIVLEQEDIPDETEDSNFVTMGNVLPRECNHRPILKGRFMLRECKENMEFIRGGGRAHFHGWKFLWPTLLLA